MRRPRREPTPDDRQATLPLAKAPARRATPTPEAIAKTVTDRDPSPPGMPDKAEITLRLALPRTGGSRCHRDRGRICGAGAPPRMDGDLCAGPRGQVLASPLTPPLAL